jgi:outer membrane protein OmpA-like peptidoglycan-associated protein
MHTGEAKQYIVFFDYPPSIELLPEVKQEIAKLVNDCKNGAAIVVHITGHNGTGSASYNRTLSEARSALVKLEIVSHGVDANRIKVAVSSLDKSAPAPLPGEVLIYPGH